MAQGKRARAAAAKREERRRQVWELTKNGASLRKIQSALEQAGTKATISTIRSDIRVRMQELIAQTLDFAEGYRAVQLERLNDMYLSLQPLLNPPRDQGIKPPPDLKAMNTALRIMEQQNALLGLNQINIHVHYPSLAQLIELIQQQGRKPDEIFAEMVTFLREEAKALPPGASEMTSSDAALRNEMDHGTRDEQQ